MFVRPLVAALSSIAVAPGPAEDLVCTPEEGDLVTRTWSETTELTLDEAVVRVEMESGEISFEDAGATLSVRRSASADEEVLGAEDGDLLSLARTYTEAEGTAGLAEEDVEVVEITSRTELAGESVRFEREDPDGEFEARFEPAGADEDLLLGLRAVAEPLGFLPAAAVEPGDSWEVDAAALGAAFAPFGDLVLLPEADEAPEGMIDLGALVAASVSALGDAPVTWSGDVTATYTASREEEGVRLVEVALAVDARAESDRTERARRAAEELGLDLEVEGFEMEAELEGEGTLVWDASAGRLRSLALHGDLVVTGAMEWRGSFFGMANSRVEASYEASGTTRVETTVE